MDQFWPALVSRQEAQHEARRIWEAMDILDLVRDNTALLHPPDHHNHAAEQELVLGMATLQELRVDYPLWRPARWHHEVNRRMQSHPNLQAELHRLREQTLVHAIHALQIWAQAQ